MKNNFTSLLILLCLSMYSQEVYFPVDNKNNFQPKIIKTNDGGYLINSSYSSYTPNLTPFEGTFRFRLIKIDNNGNEQWSFLNELCWTFLLILSRLF